MRIPLEVPGGLNSDDTTLAESPAWADGSNMRFRLERAQSIGGWESVVATLLTGVCRTVFHWTDNSAVLNVAFGTHSALMVYQGGTLSDITPFGPPTLLGAAPLSVTNASATVTVTHTAHGLASTNQVIVSGAATTGGIVAGNLNGTRAITVTGTDTYTFTAGAAASSTTTGGGSAVVITPQLALPAGAIDGAGSSGYGTGSYGGGAYGAPSTADYFPRTWSLAAWGQKLVASPRNGGLYEWSNVTATKALAIPTAPTQITHMGVSSTRQVFAFGCNQEVGGVFNPLCIRHSSVGDNTSWTTDITSGTTAREYVLPGGGRIVGHRFVGKYLLVWTSHSLFLGTYYGQVTKVWEFTKVGDKCGLIGPNAAVVVGSTAYWPSPDRQFHAYSLGGAVQAIACPIRGDFADNLAASQADKIVGSSIAEFSEVRWDYPDDRDGYENSRYVAACVEGPDIGKWYRGEMARTAMVDAGPSSYPIGTTYAGNIYFHEKGQSADGAALSGYIETAEFYLDDDKTVLLREFWPDIADQVGPLTLTIKTRIYPQGDVTEWGPYTLTPGLSKQDMKISGRYFRFKLAFNSAPARSRLGLLTVDVKTRGRK